MHIRCVSVHISIGLKLDNGYVTNVWCWRLVWPVAFSLVGVRLNCSRSFESTQNNSVNAAKRIPILGSMCIRWALKMKCFFAAVQIVLYFIATSGSLHMYMYV